MKGWRTFLYGGLNILSAFIIYLTADGGPLAYIQTEWGWSTVGLVSTLLGVNGIITIVLRVLTTTVIFSKE